MREWVGASFEQGALSVLVWLAHHQYPVATFPGHLGFMLKRPPVPCAAEAPLDRVLEIEPAWDGPC